MFGYIIQVDEESITILGDNGKKYMTHIEFINDYSSDFEEGKRVFFAALPSDDFSKKIFFAHNVSIDTGNVFDGIKCREATFDDWSLDDCKTIYETIECGVYCTPTSLVMNGKEYIGAFMGIYMHTGIIELTCYRKSLDGVAETKIFPADAKIVIDYQSMRIGSHGGISDFNEGFVTIESPNIKCTGIEESNKIEISMWSLEDYNYVLMLLKYSLYMMKTDDIFRKIEYKEYRFAEFKSEKCKEYVESLNYSFSFIAGYDLKYNEVHFSFDVNNRKIIGHTGDITIQIYFDNENITVWPGAIMGDYSIDHVNVEVLKSGQRIDYDEDWNITLCIKENDYVTSNKISVFIRYMLDYCTCYERMGNLQMESNENDTSDNKQKSNLVTENISPYEKLNNLIGLNNIKDDVNNLINLMRMQMKRKKLGLKLVPVSLHLVFTGNPGTGKTTVARILADIYREIGVLSKGHLVEVDRSGLVAGYVGQTAIKTQAKIKEAMGGILFIDEAYTLIKTGNDYGQEAIDTILKAMEDYREDFIVIVAGYTREMQKFISSNPGLKSRFNKFINFPDYTADELQQIFIAICNEFAYELEDDAKIVMKDFINSMESEKDASFANARAVRNLFEEVITRQATRLDITMSDDILKITAEDFGRYNRTSIVI